jgi:ABC-type oligopeptide transport system substrate-binding subunit
MKKRFLLACAACAFSATLLLAGCGEGKGAEDTGDDGKVGGMKTTHSSSMHTTTPTTARTTNGDLMDKAEDLVEDILPDGNVTTATNATTTKK